MGAKTIAALLVGLPAVVVAVAVSALAALLGGAADPFTGIVAGDLGRFTLLMGLGVVQGLAFGLIFLNSAVAIVVFFVIPIVLQPGGHARLVTGRRGALDRPCHRPGAAVRGRLRQPGHAAHDGENWAQLATANAIWLLLPFTVCCWRVLRSEAK